MLYPKLITLRRIMREHPEDRRDEMVSAPVPTDALPSPRQLAEKDDMVKITIVLSRESVSFFKEMAGQHGAQYQKMIRRLLDAYVRSHSRPTQTRWSQAWQNRRP